MSNSYCIGNVSLQVLAGERNVGSVGYAGGLVGDSGGIVSNCYCIGTVITQSQFDQVGGLLGHNSGTVSNSYSAGNVTGYEDVGGVVGWSAGAVSNSFWYTQTWGQTSSDGGIGKTTLQMRSIATFSGAAWNIITVAGPGTRNTLYIWNIVDGQTYPFLSWQANYTKTGGEV